MSAAPQTRTFTRIVLIGLLLAIAAAIVLGWLTEEVLEGDTSRFDAYARAAVHGVASPAFTSAMWFFTDLGSGIPLGCLFVASLTIFWIAHWRQAAVILVIVMLGAGVLVEALKLGFHRTRPVPYFGLAAPHTFSYPSGHSLFSFAFFATIAAIIGARITRAWVRATVWAAAVAIICLVGLSRIYLGVHYPTDVVAGYLTGLIWVSAVGFGDRLYLRRHRS